MPWQEGKLIYWEWDVAVICSLANSYLQSATASADVVAELAGTRKVAKYSALEDQYVFQPIAVVSWPHELYARKFLGRRTYRVPEDDRKTTFLIKRISALLFKFNSVSTVFELDDRPEH